jgi:geranylgeranyl diphosphate synthase type I
LWGVGQAINAGDGAYGLSFQFIAEADLPDLDPRIALHVQRILSKACVDTVKGQMLDLSFEGRADVQADDYRLMTALKTGPLLGAALAGGALFGGATPLQVDALIAIGRNLGVAFQIQDDILGIWGAPEQTGKSASDDLIAKKKSLPVLWAFENLSAAARAELRDLYQRAAPLSLEVAERIHTLMTEGGVRDAIQAEAQRHYRQVVEGLQVHYPASAYRVELLKLVEFIVNRGY